MIEEITAYRDGLGHIHRTKDEAVRAEFYRLFKAALMSMSSEVYNRTPVGDIAHEITCGVYPTIAPKLLEALEYWRSANLLKSSIKTGDH